MESTEMEKQGGLSGGALKYIAMAAMLLDHLGLVLFVDYYSMPGGLFHFVGRFTAPIIFFLIVEGYHHTRSPNRYTLRLALFAAISYLPFIYFSTGGLPTVFNFFTMNVLYTLLLGLLAVRARHEIRNPIFSLLAIFACFVLAQYGDWGYFAVGAILLLDVCYGARKNQQLALGVLVMVYYLVPTISYATQLPFQPYTALPYLSMALVLSGMLVPIWMIGRYNGQRGRVSQWGKWAFYVFYPLHLLALGLLRKLLLVLG